MNGTMEDHVVGHLRSLALKSLPPYDDVESAGSASEKDSLATSQPRSRSTIKLDPQRYLRPSYFDFGEHPSYDSSMNPFPFDAWDARDISIGNKPPCPDIISIPDDLPGQKILETIAPAVSSEDHSAMFIDSALIGSAPDINKRTWEWGAITESYRTASTPDTDPILQSIQRQKRLEQGKVETEETSRPVKPSRSYEPPKADSIASEDYLESLASLNQGELPDYRKRRGSITSITSDTSTGVPVLRSRRDEDGEEARSNITEADPEILTFIQRS